MPRYTVSVYLHQVIEANSEFEAKLKALEMLEKDGIRSDEIFEEGEEEGR